MDWGRPPVDPNKPGPNEFWSVHSIGISRDRRVFVADREHHRMQVFDENGKFLEMWPTGHDSAVLAHIVTAGRLHLGGGLDDGPAGQVRPERPVHPGHRRARPAARAVRRRPPDQRRSGAQPVRHRSGQRPLAEVPSEGERGSGGRSSVRWSGGGRREHFAVWFRVVSSKFKVQVRKIEVSKFKVVWRLSWRHSKVVSDNTANATFNWQLETGNLFLFTAPASRASTFHQRSSCTAADHAAGWAVLARIRCGWEGHDSRPTREGAGRNHPRTWP